MDPAALRDDIAEATATELDDLGSDGLVAVLTDGADDDARAVLEATADSEVNALKTFSTWADDAAGRDPEAAAIFKAVADQEADHRDRVLAAMDAPYDPEPGGAMHAFLRGLDGTVERVGAGMVGRSLASLRSHERLRRFFAARGDDERARLFERLHEETADTLDRGLAVLGERCDDEEAWRRARLPAEYVVQVAADEYEAAQVQLSEK